MHHCEESILHESLKESLFSVFYISQGSRMIWRGEGVCMLPQILQEILHQTSECSKYHAYLIR